MTIVTNYRQPREHIVIIATNYRYIVTTVINYRDIWTIEIVIYYRDIVTFVTCCMIL